MSFQNELSVKETAGRKFIAKVYGWMTIAMLLSAISAFLTFSMMSYDSVFFNPKFLLAMANYGYLALIIFELLLVFVLSIFIRKLPVFWASLFFIIYSVVDGMTLSVIFMVYELPSIANAFIVCTLMFLGMSIFGAFTKTNLMSFGRYLIMALFGLIVAILLNYLLKANWLSYVIDIASVLIFTGLTAYDTQKIMKTSEYYNGSEGFQKVAIIAALELYLDFINIFLSLLRLTGKRK
ncbi:MAG: Bax inhibitor-1/YccA family protein [Treponema sp.]|nr:Bax inhibitor-1/YccA family protein [Treponema sp.]